MKKILYLGSSKFGQMMNTERWQLTQGIRQNNHFIFVDVDTILESEPDIFKIWNDNSKPNAILLEDHEWSWKLKLPSRYKNINKVPVPIWAFIADYWYELSEKKKYYLQNNITGLVAMHQSAYKYIKSNFLDISNIISIPFTVDPKEFPLSLMPKEYDVVCSGFMGDLYPLRQRIRNLLKKDNSINTYFLEHPGYWKNKEKTGIQGSDFYKLLAKAKYVLSTTGIYNISVRKHLEAIGSRSKIIGNYTGFPEHRTISKLVLNLDNQMTDAVIIKTIKQAVDSWKWTIQDENLRNFVIKTHSPIYIANILSNKILNYEK